MTKEQIALIKQFLDNEPLATLIKSALTEGLADASTIDRKLSDAEIGARVRSRLDAKTFIEDKFNELARLTRTNPQPSPRNESR